MKRILLIVSHLGSGSGSLCYCLSQHRMIEWVQDGLIYDDPVQSVESVLAAKHKYSPSVGLYVNEVVYNYQISHKAIYDVCEPIYLVRNPKAAIKILKPKDDNFALSYYIFRLRRIYEMAKATENAIFLTWEDLINQRGMKLIANKLQILDLPQFQEIKTDKQYLELPKPLLRKAEDAYELCLFRLKSKTQTLHC